MSFSCGVRKHLVGNVGGIWNGTDKNIIDVIGIDGAGNDGIDIIEIGNIGIKIMGIGIDEIGIDGIGNVVTTFDRCCMVKVFGGGLGKVNYGDGCIDYFPAKFIPNGGM
ncbi:hypothetical protein L6452_09218 [Arctium lappa]|uniref:Uncharacterized protein n=1 Tax=Arctium lappa TaxID=4217 RepID=A0ACB9DK87_ARCLA|nr:hypothetical protein L6452_09218 [Arctium lappa]